MYFTILDIPCSDIINGHESKFINMKNKRYSNFHGKYCTIDNQNYEKNLKSLRKNHLLLNTRVLSIGI